VYRGLRRGASALLVLMLLMMAVPQKASAYVDLGAGTILWQIAAAVLIGSLFYLQRITRCLRVLLALRSNQSMGFLFASVFGLAISPLTMQLFGRHPLPRFNDVFLVGIVLTAYLFTWESAVYLMVISILVSAWVLAPAAPRVESIAEWYRLASFMLVAAFLISLITRMKARRSREPLAANEREAARGMAAGD
jgi:hypothetical protein